MCYPAVLIIVLNNLRINSHCRLCYPSFYGIDGGQRMRTEMLLVRGIEFFFLQIDQRTNGFVMMFRKDNIVDPPWPLTEDFGLWLTSGGCPLPLTRGFSPFFPPRVFVFEREHT